MRHSPSIAVATLLPLICALVGCGPRNDTPASREKLKEAVGCCTGTAGQVDEAKARGLFQAAAEAGGPLSRVWLAHLQASGTCGVPKDEAKARTLMKDVVDNVEALAKRGDAEAMFLIGLAYQKGFANSADKAKAMQWFRAGATAGDVNCDITGSSKQVTFQAA